MLKKGVKTALVLGGIAIATAAVSTVVAGRVLVSVAVKRKM